MTPFVLSLIEQLRPAFAAGDGGALAVCRDAAWEAGCRLRVLRARTVPIKKSNRPKRSLFGLDRTYEPWSGATLIRPPQPLTLQALEEGLRSAIERQDRADAEALAAAINAPPNRELRNIFNGIIPRADPRVPPGEAYPMPLSSVTQVTWDSGLWDPYETERMFRALEDERLGRGYLTFSNPGVADHWAPGEWIQTHDGGALRPWAQIVNVDAARQTITFTQSRTVGRPLANPIVLDRNAPHPKSRVPAHVHRNRPRLDGRRSR